MIDDTYVVNIVFHLQVDNGLVSFRLNFLKTALCRNVMDNYQ